MPETFRSDRWRPILRNYRLMNTCRLLLIPFPSVCLLFFLIVSYCSCCHRLIHFTDLSSLPFFILFIVSSKQPTPSTLLLLSCLYCTSLWQHAVRKIIRVEQGYYFLNSNSEQIRVTGKHIRTQAVQTILEFISLRVKLTRKPGVD